VLICRGTAPRAAKAILRFFAWRLSGRLIGRGSASDRSNFRCREGELKIDGLRFGFFFRFHTHRRVRGPDRRNFHTARTSKKISARKRKKHRSLSSTRVIPEISVRLARLELGSGEFSQREPERPRPREKGASPRRPRARHFEARRRTDSASLSRERAAERPARHHRGSRANRERVAPLLIPRKKVRSCVA
jgi:hypothetical protein